MNNERRKERLRKRLAQLVGAEYEGADVCVVIAIRETKANNEFSTKTSITNFLHTTRKKAKEKGFTGIEYAYFTGESYGCSQGLSEVNNGETAN